MARKTQRELVFDYILANQGATLRAVQDAFEWDVSTSKSNDSVYINSSTVRNFVRELIATRQVKLEANAGLYAVNNAYIPPPKLVPEIYSAVAPPQHTSPKTPEQTVDTILSTLNIQTAAILRHKLNEMFQ